MTKYIQFLVVILVLLNSFDLVAQHRRSLWINGIAGVNGKSDNKSKCLWKPGNGLCAYSWTHRRYGDELFLR